MDEDVNLAPLPCADWCCSKGCTGHPHPDWDPGEFDFVSGEVVRPPSGPSEPVTCEGACSCEVQERNRIAVLLARTRSELAHTRNNLDVARMGRTSAETHAQECLAALRFVVDTLHAEARWQYELHRRGVVGAQIVAERMTVVEAIAHRSLEGVSR